MKRALRVLQIFCALAVASTFSFNDLNAQWDQASPNTNTNLSRNGNVTIGNATTRSSSNTKTVINGGTNSYASGTALSASAASTGTSCSGTAGSTLSNAQSYFANGALYGVRGDITANAVANTISTKTTATEGGRFVANINDPVNSPGVGNYYISGVRGRLSGTINSYPSNGWVAAVVGEDAIQGSGTWAGYFMGRGYFEDQIGVGTTNPIADVDVRGSNIFLSPSTAAFPNQFAAMGESGGDCDLFGFTARENSGTFVNMGIKDGIQPTISFNSSDGQLDIRCDEDPSGCGSKVATFYCPNNIAIDINGGGLFAGGTYVPADRSIMTGMEEVAGAMDRLQNLRAVSFDYSQTTEGLYLPGDKQIGFVADELEKVMPEAVTASQNGLGAVNMDAVVPYLVEGVKELDNRSAADQLVNDEQSIRIQELERELAELKAMINQMAGNTASSKGAQGSMDLNAEMPRLDQNAPNPFGQVTSIKYFVPSNARSASIQVVNLAGQIQSNFDASIGNGQLEIPVGSMSDGVYFYSLIVDGAKVATRRMVVAK